MAVARDWRRRSAHYADADEDDGHDDGHDAACLAAGAEAAARKIAARPRKIAILLGREAPSLCAETHEPDEEERDHHPHDIIRGEGACERGVHQRQGGDVVDEVALAAARKNIPTKNTTSPKENPSRPCCVSC